MLDNFVAKPEGRHQGRTVQQAFEVIGYHCRLGSPFKATNNESSRFAPTQVAQQHLRGQNQGARVYLVLTCVFGCGAVGSLKNRDPIANIGPRRDTDTDTDTANLGGQGIRNIIAIQVKRRNHAVLGRPQQ